MHKRTPVAELELDDVTGFIQKIGSVYAPEHLPIGIPVRNEIADRAAFNDWWRDRSIPASSFSEQHISDVLREIILEKVDVLPPKLRAFRTDPVLIREAQPVAAGRWKIIDGKRCLIKGGSNPFRQQPFNEVIASGIMERLGIPHLSYRVIWSKDAPYSVCEDFCYGEYGVDPGVEAAAGEKAETAPPDTGIYWSAASCSASGTLRRF